MNIEIHGQSKGKVVSTTNERQTMVVNAGDNYTVAYSKWKMPPQEICWRDTDKKVKLGGWACVEIKGGIAEIKKIEVPPIGDGHTTIK
jgi:hypothetical protein